MNASENEQKRAMAFGWLPCQFFELRARHVALAKNIGIQACACPPPVLTCLSHPCTSSPGLLSLLSPRLRRPSCLSRPGTIL